MGSKLSTRLGLYHKNVKILFLGPYGAGKTTLLHRLMGNSFQVHTHTLHPSVYEVILGNIKLRAFDMGLSETARRLLPDYFENTDGIVYVIDATARNRFQEAKEELDALLQEKQLRHVPILVLGNKIDVVTAASEEELTYALGLMDSTYGKDKRPGQDSDASPIEVYMCSALRKMGYSDGLKWLLNFFI